ncbi:MAG: DUF1622 domain-containing protein [Fimbriimonas sp.]
MAATKGPDAARRYLANALLFAMSLMLAGTLLKALTLGRWNEIGLFAVIFCLRLLIKAALKADTNAVTIVPK